MPTGKQLTTQLLGEQEMQTAKGSMADSLVVFLKDCDDPLDLDQFVRFRASNARGSERFISELKSLVTGTHSSQDAALGFNTKVPPSVVRSGFAKGLPAIVAEFEGYAGEHAEEAKECMRYVLYERAGSSGKTFQHGLTRDIGRNGERLADFVSHPYARMARLDEAHVAALRIYTTAAHKVLNEPLRDVASTAAHPFPVTVAFLRDAIGKLRVVGADEDSRKVVTKLDLWRGLRDMQPSDSFLQHGGTELAPMSTTTKLEAALLDSAAPTSLLFKLRTDSFVERGASIQFLSAFPAEEEVLYPPLTFLRPTGKSTTIVHEGRSITVVEVLPSYEAGSTSQARFCTPRRHTTMACLSSFVLLIGTAVYYIHEWSAGPVAGALAYSIGFCGLLLVDLSQVWESKAAGLPVLPYCLSAFGCTSLVLGSIGAIPAVNESAVPFDRLGIVCWVIGALAVTLSQIWKVYRIMKAVESGLAELTAFLMETFFFLGAALFLFGCLLYDAGDRQAEMIGMVINPATINHIWLMGCFFYTIGPAYSFLYSGHSFDNLAYTFCGCLFICGTFAFYVTALTPDAYDHVDAYVGATFYLVGCVGYIYLDSKFFRSLPPNVTWMRINQALSVLGDVLFLSGSIGFEPAFEELGYPWNLVGIYGFICGSLTIIVAQSWKMLRLLSSAQIHESDRAALVSEISLGIGAMLFFSGASEFNSWEMQSRSKGINHLFMLASVFFLAAPLRTAIALSRSDRMRKSSLNSVARQATLSPLVAVGAVGAPSVAPSAAPTLAPNLAPPEEPQFYTPYFVPSPVLLSQV